MARGCWSAAPGFTLVAVAALAIGIGANTAIFSVVNTLLIQRLPYPDAERLAVIWEHNIPRDRKNNVISPGNFIHWRELQQSFDDIAAVGMTFNTTLTGLGDPVEIPFQYVTASFFPVVGVPPSIGRPFTEAEDRPRARLVVISDRMWKGRLNGDPAVLQKSITLGGESYAIVGVMPPGFSVLDKTVDLWMPVGFSAEARTPRGRWMMAVGRLKKGLTFEQSQRDMVRVHEELTKRFPDFNTGWTARVVPLREQLTGDIRVALYIMLGAVGFVLLIACANVANLLLARATSRQRELAVRAALGAGRARLVRQLLAESLVLAGMGGLAGLLLAWWALHLLRVVVAERLPIQRLELVGIDGSVLGFTLLASLVCGIVFGLVPAFSAAGGGLTNALKEGGRTGSAARGKRARSAFVVVEVALALVLLVGAGLLVRSFMRVLEVDAGFDPDRTITMRVALSGPRYAGSASADAVLSDRIRPHRRPARGPGRRRRVFPPDSRPWVGNRLRGRRPTNPSSGTGTGDRCPGRRERLLQGDGHPPAARAAVQRAGRRRQHEQGDRQRSDGAPSLAERGSDRQEGEDQLERRSRG